MTRIPLPQGRRQLPFAVLVLNQAKPKTAKELEAHISALEREADELAVEGTCEYDHEAAILCLQSAVILEKHRRRLEETENARKK